MAQQQESTNAWRQTRAVTETIVREHWGRVLATLVSLVRDMDVAEDLLQDACLVALQNWPRDGVPDKPAAWLLRTARNRAIDRFRREANFASKRAQLQHWLTRPGEENENHAIGDERLRLVFTCCHPSLAKDARVALTLRTLAGLTTAEIARAFMVSEATMAQRLVRAKRKIKAAGIPYKVPAPELWPERLESVLAVVYFVFNESYTATTGADLLRPGLAEEALRLGGILAKLMPHEPEVLGLLALMLLHDARRPARTGAAGELVALADQDRGLWDRARIDQGEQLLRAGLAMGRIGPYQVQAAISAAHAQAANYAATDWREILLLYRKLHGLQPSPVILLNAAVALAELKGPARGLAALVELAESLAEYQPYHAARADLLRRSGRISDAAAAYRQAIALTGNAAEQRFLEDRLAGLTG